MHFDKQYGVMWKTSYEHYIIDMITAGLPLHIKFHRIFDAVDTYEQNQENDFIYNNKYRMMIDRYISGDNNYFPRACIEGREVHTQMKKSEHIEIIIRNYFPDLTLY